MQPASAPSAWPTHWVFLRGLSREQRHWGNFPERCATELGWQITHLDLPGFGDQHRRLSPRTMSAIAADLAARMPWPDTDMPVGILGLSLGAMAALKWVDLQPQSIAALVLINGSAADCPLHWRLQPGALPPMLSALGRRSIKQQERAILNLVSNRPPAIDAALSDWVQIRQQARLQKRNVFRQLLAASTARSPSAAAMAGIGKALVLSSRGDRMVSWRCSERLASKYQWPLALHPDAGHDLSLDDPEWIIRQLVAQA